MNHPTARVWLTRRQRLIDLGLALVVGTASLLITAKFANSWSADDRVVGAFALSLVAVAFGSLAVRRVWPLIALAISTVAASIYLLATYPYGPVFLAFFIAVYTVATLLPLRTAGVAVAAALAVMLSHVFVHPNALGGWLGLIPGSAWAVVPFAIGATVRMSREGRESARAESVREQVYEERMRLAREVHDIVGHGLAAIQMQADIALHVDEQQSTETRTALESISRASSAAFEELRMTLDVMSGPRNAPRAPAVQELADIEQLCDRIRATGVTVDLVMTGAARVVPPAVGLAAYRVVQESLTNVIRHGEVSAAKVTIAFDDDIIHVNVTNPGSLFEDAPAGRGLTGMRNRVVALGGTFDAGATSDGYEVTARIPIGEDG